MFGPKIKHIAGDSMKLHDYKLHYVYLAVYTSPLRLRHGEFQPRGILG